MTPQEATKLLTASLPREVVEALATLYPNVLPENPVSEANLARQIGQQDVIKLLRRVVQERDEPTRTR